MSVARAAEDLAITLILRMGVGLAAIATVGGWATHTTAAWVLGVATLGLATTSWLARLITGPDRAPLSGPTIVCSDCRGIGYLMVPTRRRWPRGRGLKQHACTTCGRHGQLQATGRVEVTLPGEVRPR